MVMGDHCVWVNSWHLTNVSKLGASNPFVFFVTQKMARFEFDCRCGLSIFCRCIHIRFIQTVLWGLMLEFRDNEMMEFCMSTNTCIYTYNYTYSNWLRGSSTIHSKMTNMSSENQWLEDAFPIEIVPFLRKILVFRGCTWSILAYDQSRWLPLLGFLCLFVLEAANASYHGMSPLSDVIRNAYLSNFDYHTASMIKLLVVWCHFVWLLLLHLVFHRLLHIAILFGISLDSFFLDGWGISVVDCFLEPSAVQWRASI